jgi:hypothetical protein
MNTAAHAVNDDPYRTDPYEPVLDGRSGGPLDMGSIDHAGADPLDPEDVSDSDGESLGEPETKAAAVTPSREDRKLVQMIVDAAEEYKGLENEQGQIAAAKRSILEKLEGKGIKRSSFKAALSYDKADEDQRAGYDLSYGICRAAFGHSINPEHFALSTQPAAK